MYVCVGYFFSPHTQRKAVAVVALGTEEEGKVVRGEARGISLDESVPIGETRAGG